MEAAVVAMQAAQAIQAKEVLGDWAAVVASSFVDFDDYAAKDVAVVVGAAAADGYDYS